MRKSNGCSFIKMLAIIFILMFIANFTVLRVHFGIRLSDLAPLLEGDSSIKGDSPIDGDGFATDNVSYEGEGDSHAEGDGSIEGDGFAADVVSAESEGDSHVESDYSFGSLIESGEAVKLLDNLSLRDKITLAYIVARIGKDELRRFFSISEDGITADEITALREYAGERLDPSDIEALEDIFHRNQHLYSEVLR